MSKKKIKVGSVVKMHNAYNNFYYRVVDIPNEETKRFQVFTEDGIRFYAEEDLTLFNPKKLTKKEFISFIRNGHLIQKVK